MIDSYLFNVKRRNGELAMCILTTRCQQILHTRHLHTIT